jgi:tRNA(Ile)-lysidine synthase
VLEQLLIHINRYALCKTTDKILLAVSGGIDSMVMLHLMKEAGFALGVVHCNFKLRGQESDGDAAFVQEISQRMHLPFFTTEFETSAYATAAGISVQMAAAELRYKYFDELLQSEGFNLVATAHHFNDTIESVLLNLVRGTGIDGVRGIASKKGNLIRPMLFATRSMILEHALTEKIQWREDASNLSDDYQRNFVRHQVIPKFQEMNPRFEEGFRETHERLLGAALFSQSYVKAFASTAVEICKQEMTIDSRKIRQSESPAVLLWELIKDRGFKYDQCRRIVLDHQPGKLFTSDSYQLLVDRNVYIIEKKKSSDFLSSVIEQGQRLAGQPPFVLQTKEVAQSEFKMVKDSSLAQLDADQLQWPLVWRKWQAGDYFVPLGMRQEKKLSDFLIDLKIPFNSKADITVLESAGDIVWVVGYRISERYKVTADTKRILVIEQSDGGD